MRKQFHHHGFTLVEILIALMIFSILALISTYSMKNILSNYRNLQQNYRQWNQLNQAIHRLQMQTNFFIRRPMVANDNHRFPIFIGQHDYVEWTFAEPHEELRRIAYRCQGNQLVFRKWSVLDPINRENTQEQIVLNGLTNCHFRYLNSKQQITGYWSAEDAPNPIGLQLLITFKEKQKLELWFALPPYRYEKETA